MPLSADTPAPVRTTTLPPPARAAASRTSRSYPMRSIGRVYTARLGALSNRKTAVLGVKVAHPYFAVAPSVGRLEECRRLSRSSRIALGLCAVLAPPLWACATGAGEDRGRGTDEDGGPTDKPGLRDGGGPDAFGADDIDAATLDVIDGGSSDGGCAGGPVDLLANGNFDGGPGGPWVETSSGGFELILPEGDPDLPFEVTPDSGRFLLYMGGYNDATDAIHQVVSVPADAGGVRLRGAGRIDTDEMLDLPFDQVFIEIASPEGELVEELGRVSNQDA